MVALTTGLDDRKEHDGRHEGTELHQRQTTIVGTRAVFKVRDKDTNDAVDHRDGDMVVLGCQGRDETLLCAGLDVLRGCREEIEQDADSCGDREGANGSSCDGV